MDRRELIEDIRIELENLERLNKEMNQLLERIRGEPDFIKVRAAGSILHDFYCGVEKIFERIALNVDRNLPEGENWHTELLYQMAKPWGDARGAVITEDMLQNLKEYLRFRHLFRNIYGFELKWERCKTLGMMLGKSLKIFRKEIKEFLKFIGLLAKKL